MIVLEVEIEDLAIDHRERHPPVSGDDESVPAPQITGQGVKPEARKVEVGRLDSQL